MTSCRPSGWSDVFDATFIISLQRRRSTRLELLGRQLQQLGRVAYTVHPAVDGASLNRTAWQRRMYNVKNSTTMSWGTEAPPGAVGCYLSHLQVLERALALNVSRVVVLEDDARLDVVGLSNQSLGVLRRTTWDLAYLGYNTLMRGSGEYGCAHELHPACGVGWCRLEGQVRDLVAYAVSGAVLPFLVRTLRRRLHAPRFAPVDHEIGSLHQQLRVAIAYPKPLAWQSDRWRDSDITHWGWAKPHTQPPKWQSLQ